MSNPYMASVVKRAHRLCPVYFGFLDSPWIASQCGSAVLKNQYLVRTGVIEMLRIEAAAGLRVRFSLAVTSGRAGRRRDALKPLSDGRPRPRRSRAETVARTAIPPSPIACHAVEAHRFPEHRPFILGVHPTSPRREGGSLSSCWARARGNHAFSIPLSSRIDIR